MSWNVFRKCTINPQMPSENGAAFSIGKRSRICNGTERCYLSRMEGFWRLTELRSLIEAPADRIPPATA